MSGLFDDNVGEGLLVTYFMFGQLSFVIVDRFFLGDRFEGVAFPLPACLGDQEDGALRGLVKELIPS